MLYEWICRLRIIGYFSFMDLNIKHSKQLPSNLYYDLNARYNLKGPIMRMSIAVTDELFKSYQFATVTNVYRVNKLMHFLSSTFWLIQQNNDKRK